MKAPGKIEDLTKLCIHTVTTKPWAIEVGAEKFAAAGVKGITVWRDALADRKPAAIGADLRNLGLEIVSYCRGGFWPSKSKEKRELAIKDNLQMVEEAAALGAPMIVLVCGAEPGQDLQTSRDQIKAGIEATLPLAESHGVKLAIEPLHPMYAGDRSAINTMEQANDMAEYFKSPYVGVAVDVYHLWWDPHLEQEIERCGKSGNLHAFHICDWKVPTNDLLLDRGIMGEGCIDVPKIRGWVEATGFSGYNEVEIFSSLYWNEDQDQYLDKIIKGYLEHS